MQRKQIMVIVISSSGAVNSHPRVLVAISAKADPADIRRPQIAKSTTIPRVTYLLTLSRPYFANPKAVINVGALLMRLEERRS
ncbi:hypothetical protein L916_12119 [Phytophthora nicotianae]|nr:hypothetical protein L916_12119 [Phytophthora nicotianae]